MHENPFQKYPLFANKSLNEIIERNHCNQIIAIKSLNEIIAKKSLQSNHLMKSFNEIIAIKSLQSLNEIIAKKSLQRNHCNQIIAKKSLQSMIAFIEINQSNHLWILILTPLSVFHGWFATLK
jgi:hypothetical protein